MFQFFCSPLTKKQKQNKNKNVQFDRKKKTLKYIVYQNLRIFEAEKYRNAENI